MPAQPVALLDSALSGYRFLLAHPVEAAKIGAPFSLVYLISLYVQAAAQANPGLFGWSFLMLLVFLGVGTLTISAFYRLAMTGRVAGFHGFAVGGDEKRVLAVLALLLILVFIVALIAVVPVLAIATGLSYAIAAREGVPVETLLADGEDIRSFYAFSDWAIMGGAVGLVFVFSAWIGARLSFAFPASLDHGRIEVMKAWPVAAKQGWRVTVALVGALAPVALLFFGLSAALGALTGQFPLEATRYAQEGVTLSAPGFLLTGLPLAVLYGNIGLPVFIGVSTAMYRQLAAPSDAA